MTKANNMLVFTYLALVRRGYYQHVVILSNDSQKTLLIRIFGYQGMLDNLEKVTKESLLA